MKTTWRARLPDPVRAFFLLAHGDLFVISRPFFEQDCPALGIDVTFVDIRDLEQVASR